jgi:hypothetical protein
MAQYNVTLTPMLRGEIIAAQYNVTLTTRKFNSIWVIVDRLTKSTHFIPVHNFYRAEKYAEMYISHIMCLHGVPKTIISDRGS